VSRVIVYHAHPGQRFSRVNSAMVQHARSLAGITVVDLYAEYPRFDINVDREQARLLEHDVLVFQFPLFWYSTPALVKEWQDLVLEHGFAYGAGGDRLAGKRLLLAISAAGPEDAYAPGGYQRHALRSFLRPLEQTAALCRMEFLPPYVIYGALGAAAENRIAPHVQGFGRLLCALRDDRFRLSDGGDGQVLTHARLGTDDTNGPWR